MPSLFNVLVCILMMLIGIYIGQKIREHKNKKGKMDPKGDLSRKANLNQKTDKSRKKYN